MKLLVTGSGNACGAEIKFNLTMAFDDRIFGEIQQAFHDHIVVYFISVTSGSRTNAI